MQALAAEWSGYRRSKDHHGRSIKMVRGVACHKRMIFAASPKNLVWPRSSAASESLEVEAAQERPSGQRRLFGRNFWIRLGVHLRAAEFREIRL